MEDKTAEDKADANEENLSAEEDADTDKKIGAEQDAEQGGKAEKGKKKIGRKDKAEEEVTLTKKEADKILNKLAELNDKYLHVVAEYDNFRKRSQKEREGLYADAYADALKIPVSYTHLAAATTTIIKRTTARRREPWTVKTIMTVTTISAERSPTVSEALAPDLIRRLLRTAECFKARPRLPSKKMNFRVL